MKRELKEGVKAPDFSLPADDGGEVRLSDYLGKQVVLYFYPKDMTPGCTCEANDFTANLGAFKKKGVVVLGVSPDSTDSHKKFIKKEKISFALLSDESKKTLEAYGVWKEKSMYGKKYMGVERSTFLIDKHGVIKKIWRKVSVPGHAEEVLAAV
ncbi:MAG: thioredoxin-dependent thiol peroxidase [Candidatus Lloydbacteria bacterium]|nr:thioredoxin-dependent thiol peroxidase [Candidatus Lloydbacteria bacterium]